MQEKEQWMNLCEAVSHRCYIIGDTVYHRPGLLKDEIPGDDFKSSAVSLRLEQMNTISEILACIKKLEGKEAIALACIFLHELFSVGLAIISTCYSKFLDDVVIVIVNVAHWLRHVKNICDNQNMGER